MAVFAVCRGGQVIARLAAQYVPVVATYALTADRDILMKYPGVPVCVATLVTAVTVVDCKPCQRLVRNVIGRWSIRRWIGSTVTGRTLVGHQSLGVIPTGRFPSRNAVATGAVRTGWNVNAVFSCGIGTVVATGAVACRRERAVIRFGTRPVSRGLVTAVTG